MQIRRESKGNVGEQGARQGGVKVSGGGAAGDKAVKEADRNSCNEAEKESEYRY